MILAPDLERISSEGGLDSAVDNIIRNFIFHIINFLSALVLYLVLVGLHSFYFMLYICVKARVVSKVCVLSTPWAGTSWAERVCAKSLSAV